MVLATIAVNAISPRCLTFMLALPGGITSSAPPQEELLALSGL